MEYDIESGNLPQVKDLMFKKSRTPSQISALKGNKMKCRSFIVADLETSE